MLHIISAAMTIAAASSTQDPTALLNDIMRLQEEYKRCLIDQTVELGAFNTESAETILRAVGAACLTKELELRATYAQTPFPRSQVEGLMHRDRKLGEDAGVVALLRVRAQRAPAS